MSGGLGVVWRFAAATTLMLTAFSMTGPVLAVLLQQRGYPTAAIGAFAMLPFLVIGCLIPLMPRVLARWGLVRTYRTGAALQLVAALAYALTDSFAAWAAASMLVGLGSTALWNATEALLASEAPPDQRGHVMGLYQTLLGGALALGPFLPGLLRIGAPTVLWVAVAGVAACLLLALTVPVAGSPEPAQGAGGGTWAALRRVPVLAGLAFAGGVFEAGLNSVSAAYAASTGLSVAAAASVAGAIGIGSFACQYPAGWLADRHSPRAVYGGAALLLLAASLAFALAMRWPWLLWGVGLVWGGVGGALYTLSMIRVAHAFEGQATAGGTAAMISGYTWGGTLGPLATGAALQAGGVAAMAALLCALAIAALAGALRLPPR